MELGLTEGLGGQIRCVSCGRDGLDEHELLGEMTMQKAEFDIYEFSAFAWGRS